MCHKKLLIKIIKNINNIYKKNINIFKELVINQKKINYE